MVDVVFFMGVFCNRPIFLLFVRFLGFFCLGTRLLGSHLIDPQLCRVMGTEAQPDQQQGSGQAGTPASTWLTRTGPHHRLSIRSPSIMYRPRPYQAA